MITRKKRAVIAVALSLIMALAYMPCVAFATGDSGQDNDKSCREFIDQKINEQGGTDLDDMIAICKTYSSVTFTPVTDDHGTTYSSVADIANSADFEKVVDRACTYGNLKKDIAYIREANAHRNLSIHNAGSLKVSYQLMGTAIISAAINEYVMGHNLMKGEQKRAFWYSGNASTVGENLAFSSASSEQKWDPFHGWYYEERISALAGENAAPDQSLVDSVLAESTANGYPYDPYGAPWYQSESDFLSWVTGMGTGHYESLIDPKFKATGLSYIDATEYAVSDMPYVASQEFNNDTDDSVPVDQFEQELNAWVVASGGDTQECEHNWGSGEITKQPSCVEEGIRTYTCGICGETRTETIDKLAHTPGDPVRENEKAASCTATGSYDEVVYCTKCNAELSRVGKTIDKLAHTPGDPVRENERAASCTAAGSYDEVVYCTKCNAELSRVTKTISKLGHTQGSPVREHEVAATCAKAGSYDEVVYCTKCNAELSRVAKTINKLDHTPGDPVRENEVAPSYTEEGSYDEVVYCTKCGNEISREKKTIDKLDDTQGGDTPGGDDPQPVVKTSIEGAKVVLSKATFTYNAKVQKPVIQTIGGETLTEGTDYTAVWSNNNSKNAGTYKVTITGTGNYEGTATATYKISKATNPMTVKGRTATVKYSKLKKRTQTVKRTAVLTVAKNQGKVTYVKSSGNKKITISKTTGKVTVKKGLKKGKYKVKVKVTAAGNTNYNKKTLVRTFTVRVK